MPKEKSINPAQAQRKAEKKQAIKKGKAQIATQRQTRLASRNPTRLESQISTLQKIESSGGKLTSHERSVLEGLEKELKAVRKARAGLGENAPSLGRDGGGVLGKRGRDGDGEGRGRGKGYGDGEGQGGSSDEGEEEGVEEVVQRIPMPRDTPPPISKPILDKWWARRRARLGLPSRSHQGTNANSTPLGPNNRFTSSGFDAGSQARNEQRGGNTGREAETKVEMRTVYEAAPVTRNLRKEAMAFVPGVVREKIERVRGRGGQGALVEPEELDRLEGEGYVVSAGGGGRGGEVGGEIGREREREERVGRTVMLEEVEDEDG